MTYMLYSCARTTTQGIVHTSKTDTSLQEARRPCRKRTIGDKKPLWLDKAQYPPAKAQCPLIVHVQYLVKFCTLRTLRVSSPRKNKVKYAQASVQVTFFKMDPPPWSARTPEAWRKKVSSRNLQRLTQTTKQRTSKGSTPAATRQPQVFLGCS